MWVYYFFYVKKSFVSGFITFVHEEIGFYSFDITHFKPKYAVMKQNGNIFLRFYLEVKSKVRHLNQTLLHSFKEPDLTSSPFKPL